MTVSDGNDRDDMELTAKSCEIFLRRLLYYKAQNAYSRSGPIYMSETMRLVINNCNKYVEISL